MDAPSYLSHSVRDHDPSSNHQWTLLADEIVGVCWFSFIIISDLPRVRENSRRILYSSEAGK